MAHRRHHRHHRREHYRHNPEVFGVDIEDTALAGVGIFAASAVSKGLVAPLVTKVAKPAAGSAMAKVVDVGSAIGSAVLVGEVAGMFNKRVARDLRNGGLAFGGAKAVGAVTGAQIDPTGPALFDRLRLPGSATKAVDAPKAAPALPPGGVADYPAPADSDSNVGL